jgi:hypothetical protein
MEVYDLDELRALKREAHAYREGALGALSRVPWHLCSIPEARRDLEELAEKTFRERIRELERPGR